MNWKNINDLVEEAMGHYWVYDTNEGVVEAYWDPDHRIMQDRKGKVLVAVTHFKDYYVPSAPGSDKCKDLIEYLIKESNYEYTEFRLVVRDDGHCYIHVYDRSSETYDFDLPNKLKYERNQKIKKLTTNLTAQDAYIDWTTF